ncbi:MAG: DMT family transporter [Patescibacteria group bacterium]
MDFSKIFNSDYLFKSAPAESRLNLYYLIIFVALIVFAILIKFSKQDRKIKNRQFYIYLTGGILGLIYVFARHEGLPYLSARIVLLVIIAGLLASLTYLTIWMARYIPKMNNKKFAEEKYQKYLPKSKKRK